MSRVFRTNQIDKSLNRLDSKLVNLIVDGPDERVLRAQRLSRLIYLTADWLGLDHFVLDLELVIIGRFIYYLDTLLGAVVVVYDYYIDILNQLD